MTNQLAKLSELADDLFKAQTEVDRLNLELAAAQKEVQRLQETALPEAMAAVGMDEFKTKSGLKITVEAKLSAKKLTEKHARALQWLRDNGQGGLIKTVLGIPFAKGSDADADAMLEKLAGEGIAAVKQVEVHHSSLAAAIKRMMEEGVDVPLELLGGYSRDVAKVEQK